MTHESSESTLSDDVRRLLGGLSKADLAFIVGRPPHWVAQRVEAGQLSATTSDRRAWRRFTPEQVLAAIQVSALCRGGLTPAAAADIIHKQQDLDLGTIGLSREQAEVVRDDIHRSIARARQLPRRQTALDREREAALRKARQAIRSLPGEAQKVLLFQDLAENLDQNYVIPALLLAAGALNEDAKHTFLATFLQANPKVWGNVVINTCAAFDPETKRNLIQILSESVHFQEGQARPGTRIERGASEFAGVCVHGDRVLLISPGRAGPAFAATLSEDDARLLLDDMDRELARDEDPPRTFVRTFDRADRVAVFVGQPNHICIGAGEQGGIVAELSCEDFARVRDALAEMLKPGSFRIPAIAAAEGAGSSAHLH